MSLATARANTKPGGAAAVERLMRPRSVVIIGISFEARLRRPYRRWRT